MRSMFKRMAALFMALTLLCLAGCMTPNVTTGPSGTVGSTPVAPSNTTTQPTTPTTVPNGDGDEYFLPKEEGCNQLTIYWNYPGDVTTAGFWIWPEGGNGAGYVVYQCEFGVKCMVNIPKEVTRVGFIACYGAVTVPSTSWIGGTKDFDGDRYVDMNGDVTIYIKQGDGMIYNSKQEAGAAAAVINFAEMTSFTTIKYNLPVSTRIETLDQIKVYKDGQTVEVVSSSTLGNKVNHGVITLAEKMDIGAVYTLEIDGFESKMVVPTKIFDSEEFIAGYTYDGDDLGAVVQGDGSTTFKVWAPTASQVVLNLFTAGNGVEAYDNLQMTKSDKGVWVLNVPATGHGTYYTYSVTTAMGTQEAVDPYAKACGVNGDRGMVINLALTDPANWNLDQFVELEKYSDATIWEIHVRDFSNTMENSQYRGKYLAFTERGLKNSAGISIGVDYLLELGVSHLHILPMYDYASVNEENPSFNWGYDPENYNCLEGSYSTDPYNGEVRVLEFKQMVQSLHGDGLGVIMDVVYNHTYDANSNLNKVVPYYYYRYDATGKNTNASGCGNDTASERYMYRKYMVDSVSYLASEYHLDGFRFDLMGLHDVETMQAIERAVHAINPNAIIYGEAWDMAGGTTDAVMMTQRNASLVTATEGAAGAVAVFNDTTRDGLKGSVWDAVPHGFINGKPGASVNAVKFGMAGASIGGSSWTVKNANVVNYMSCHDNMTLWDILTLACPDDDVETLMARNRLGIGVILTSQGTAFWQAGEEMLRTKNGDHNSYNSGDAINNINWDVLTAESNEYAMMRYYKGLIEMRKAYGIFRSDGSDVTITFESMDGGVLVASFTASDGSKAMVILNPTDAAVSYTLEGEWNLVANGTQAGAETISTESGVVSVEAMSILVFVQ